MAMTLKDVFTTTVEDIRNIKNIDKAKLLSIVRETTKLAKQRKTILTRNLSREGIALEPTVLHKRPDAKQKGQPFLNFNIDYNRVNSRGGFAYLLSVYARAREFITAKTSTVSGWEHTLEKFKNTIESDAGEVDWGSFFSSKRINKQIFKLYTDLKNNVPSWGSLGSAKALKSIIEYKSQNRKLSYTELRNDLEKMGDNYYTEQQQKINTRLIESGAEEKFDLLDDL